MVFPFLFHSIQMFFPKPDSMIQPTISIGPVSQSKTVAGSFISAILDLNSGASQVLYTPVNNRVIHDRIIGADGYERWREITGVT
jgi:hypothetical protein